MIEKRFKNMTADEWVRTCDSPNQSPTLYQLSHLAAVLSGADLTIFKSEQRCGYVLILPTEAPVDLLSLLLTSKLHVSLS